MISTTDLLILIEFLVLAIELVVIFLLLRHLRGMDSHSTTMDEHIEKLDSHITKMNEHIEKLNSHITKMNEHIVELKQHQLQAEENIGRLIKTLGMPDDDAPDKTDRD